LSASSRLRPSSSGPHLRIDPFVVNPDATGIVSAGRAIHWPGTAPLASLLARKWLHRVGLMGEPTIQLVLWPFRAKPSFHALIRGGNRYQSF